MSNPMKADLIQALTTGAVPVISIQQPWAGRILFDGKDIENRRWATRHRGWTLVHAGKSIDTDTPWFREEHSFRESRGGIVGAVQIVDMVRESSSPWFHGPVGWQLANPIALPALVPCRGKLSLFQPPAEVIAQVIEGLRA